MTEFQKQILEALARPGAPYGLPKLDMILTSGGADPRLISGGLLAAVRELEGLGLVSGETHENEHTRYTLYAASDAGRRQIEALASAAGR